jgi:hypothetical protein
MTSELNKSGRFGVVKTVSGATYKLADSLSTKIVQQSLYSQEEIATCLILDYVSPRNGTTMSLHIRPQDIESLIMDK